MKEYLQKLNNSVILPSKPPCIFNHLLLISQGRQVNPFPVLYSVNTNIKLSIICTALLAIDKNEQVCVSFICKNDCLIHYLIALYLYLLLIAAPLENCSDFSSITENVKKDCR